MATAQEKANQKANKLLKKQQKAMKNPEKAAKKAERKAEREAGKDLKDKARQAKLARKGQNKLDRKTYGRGKEGKANKAADIARKAAASKMEEVGMSDSMDDTSMDGASMANPMRKMGGSMSEKKMGASMMEKKGASMSGENYDAKQAYNKNLSASARLHYLENNRADKKAKGGSHRSPIMKHMKNI